MITLSKENVVDYVKSRLDFFNPDGDIKVSAIGEGTVEETEMVLLTLSIVFLTESII